MINKTKLVDIIEKYYLNGLTEAVKINITDGIINIPFNTTNKNVVGKITSVINLPNTKLGIFETSPLLKLLNILDKDIEIQYQETGGVTEKLLIEDNQYKMSFSLSDIFLITDPAKSIEVPYEITYNMEPDFITRFVECKKALGSDITTFTLECESDGKLKIILGDPSGYANKLEFSVQTEFNGFPPNPLLFPSDVVKEILIANKNFDSAIMKVNTNGLLCFIFTEDDTTSEYYVLASSE